MCFVQIKIGGGGVKCASYCIRNRFRNRYSEIKIDGRDDAGSKKWRVHKPNVFAIITTFPQKIAGPEPQENPAVTREHKKTQRSHEYVLYGVIPGR